MFDIFFDQLIVGKAEMKKDGLYYRIHCTCTPHNTGIYRIVINDGGNIHDLGICVPVNDKFVVNTRIPTKHIKSEHPRFNLIPATNIGTPIATEKPFAQLDKLETARLQVTNGQSEIIIDPVPIPPDSDQNQEYLHISESE